MTSYPFVFAGQSFLARASGALFWPDQDALIVADLHLGRSERMARRGGSLLPPYDTRATLDLLAAELAATGAGQLFLLGDSFDDNHARQGLGPELARLQTICAGIGALWITGNHDPACDDLTNGAFFGPALEHHQVAGIGLCHIAAHGPDISGHYHPKLRIAGQYRPAFLIGQDHLILPAFGVYTGGMDADRAELRALVPEGLAILTGQAARPVPLRPMPRPRGMSRF